MSSLSSVGSSLTGLNTSGIQFSGLASGLDTNQIIQGLLAVQQAQITNLQNTQSGVVQEQSALKTVEAKLLALQSQAGQLGQTFNSVFDAKTVSSSNQAVAAGAASSSAAPGVYSFTVNNLAQAEQLASQGFADPNATITQGTLQIQVGSGATSTITIDGSNNTLQGLANAINSAGGDVSASILNTGSGTQPYQLLLTSKKTGAANAITITNHLAASSGGATQPTLTSVVQPAADASITVGSGSGALTIKSPTNQVDGVFTGITLNLLAPSSTPVNLTVANDTTKASTAVNDFVTSFNDLITYIQSQSSYDPQTTKAGVLLGNETAISVQEAITGTVGEVVAGVNNLANHLSAIGITLNDQGQLAVDNTKLGNAVSGQLPGVTADDVRRLFGLDGQSSNNGIQFISAPNQTQTSATPYQVVVTQAASHAGINATNPLAGPIAIDNSNNTLTLTVDGRASGTITLATGTYTPQTLAQELQNEINANGPLSGAAVTVGTNGNQLQITSQSYGAHSQVTIGTGTALSVLGFNGTETAHGQDVAGQFLVNGVAEAATGNGQFLTGGPSNAHTAGLEVRVTLAGSQVQTRVTANLTVTRGIASQLGQTLNTFLDPVSGRLQNVDQSLQTTVNNIQKTIDEQNALLQARQQSLLQQFTAMETAIAQLKAAGSFLGSLTQSIGALGNPTPAASTIGTFGSVAPAASSSSAGSTTPTTSSSSG